MIDFRLFATGSDQGFVEELFPFQNGELAVASKLEHVVILVILMSGWKTSSVLLKPTAPLTPQHPLPPTTCPHQQSISL